MFIVTSRTDIETWIMNRRGDVVEAELNEKLVKRILNAGHPPWGRDWEEWLTSNVAALVEELEAPMCEVPHLSLCMVAEKTHRLPRQTIWQSTDTASVATELIGRKPVEHLIVIGIDGQNNITGVATVAQGGMHGCGISPADVLRVVLAMHASAFVLAHNHPSGDPTPSRQDIEMTSKVREAAKIVGLILLDHVVVSRTGNFACVVEP